MYMERTDRDEAAGSRLENGKQNQPHVRYDRIFSSPACLVEMPVPRCLANPARRPTRIIQTCRAIFVSLFTLTAV